MPENDVWPMPGTLTGRLISIVQRCLAETAMSVSSMQSCGKTPKQTYRQQQ
jgi:hypothetical protein